jgi:predicted short-subunit dehydrogenase-like oxidoreductase (DUF2520 family)
MLMSAAGIGENEALAALAPLVKASAANAIGLGPVRALTGPLERGDAATVAAHCSALAVGIPSSVRGLYRAAGLHALEIARRRGLSEADARKLEEILRKGSDEDV